MWIRGHGGAPGDAGDLAGLGRSKGRTMSRGTSMRSGRTGQGKAPGQPGDQVSQEKAPEECGSPVRCSLCRFLAV